jgi:hypothetical protein
MTAYNLSSFAGAGAQFFDDSGNPLTGGKIYTYGAGTTTPAATYTTSAGTVANTNPIILDAAGRTPNEIWLPVGVLYKFVVKTSTDVLIGTFDGLPAINDPYSINSLLGSVTGTNAIAATATPAVTAYATGATYSFIAANTNTGAATLSIDGLAAKSITKNSSVALTAGDIQAGKLTWVEYDGTTFQLLNNIIYGGSITNGTINSLTAPMTVANGGTGVATLAANSVVLGNGVAAVQTVAPSTSGNMLISDGTTWTSQPFGAPIIGSFSGLKVQATSNTAVTVTAAFVTLGATNASYTASTISLSLATSTSGANGLDAGSVATSTWYSVWVIYNGTTVAGLLSTSASAPTLPSGYTYKARVGWVRTDGSSNLLRTIQYGNRAQYVATASGYPTIASGAATQWTAASVTGLVPTSASAISMVLAIENNISARAAVAPNNAPTSLLNSFMFMNGNSAYPNSATMSGTMILESTSVYYYGNSATAAINYLSCTGWIDNL